MCVLTPPFTTAPGRRYPGQPDDIQYNAVGSLGEERGNGTGTGSEESMESKLEQLPSISSVEVCALAQDISSENVGKLGLIRRQCFGIARPRRTRFRDLLLAPLAPSLRMQFISVCLAQQSFRDAEYARCSSSAFFKSV